MPGGWPRIEDSALRPDRSRWLCKGVKISARRARGTSASASLTSDHCSGLDAHAQITRLRQWPSALAMGARPACVSTLACRPASHGSGPHQHAMKKPLPPEQGRLGSWCPRPESNRHDREVEGFSCHFGFRRQRGRCSWSGARLHPSLDGRRCPPSALYTFPQRLSASGLGSALARTLAHPGRSPTLTGFTSRVSPEGLKFLQVPCVYQFHHSGWLDA
jgi:hypothetical protein